MSKKKTDVMAREREKFIHGDEKEGVPGCIKNGISEAVANEIFDEMTDFAKYAFNKSHAAAYSVVAYQTAWLKTYYPVEFMAALLTSVADNNDKVREYIAECRRMNIKLLPPDINEGFRQFTVTGGNIRFGLAAIKSVGRSAVEAMSAERRKNGKYISITQFIERTHDIMNTKCIESLIRSGAFDSLGGKRSQYLAVFRLLHSGKGQSSRNNLTGQLDLFSIMAESPEEVYKDVLPDIPELSVREKLMAEKEILGIYVSGNPVEEYMPVMKRFISCTTLDFPRSDEEIGETGKIKDGDRAVIGGLVEKVSVKYTKKEQKMAFITVEDIDGSIEVIVFPKVYDKFKGCIEENRPIVVSGRASVSEDQQPKVIADAITTYEELADMDKTLWLKLSRERETDLAVIQSVLERNHGNAKVIIYDEKNAKKMTASPRYYARLTDGLIEELENLLGRGCVVVK